jgi:hypothetical protein
LGLFKKLNVKKAVGLLNAILTKWGYTKIQTGKRKKVRVEGVEVDVGNFKVVSSITDEEKNSNPYRQYSA